MGKFPVIVDKSFLQGQSKAAIFEFSQENRILMTKALLYELLSNPTDRRSCFEKLPATTNPVDIVMHAGGYLRILSIRHCPSRYVDPQGGGKNRA